MFEISRASKPWGIDKPCDEAFQKDKSWYVKLNTPEDLYKFIKKYKKVIIEIDDEWDKKTIVIYDDYYES